MKCALRAKGLYDIATGIIPIPNDDRLLEKQRWIRDDSTAMFILTSALELSQITLIENCQTSKEIVDKLDSIYEQKSELNKMLVHERFHQYVMNPSDTVAQHVAKVENLARHIKDTGETISDTAVITKIIGTLPIKYRNFRQAWLSTPEDKQTLTNLTARLLDEEACLTSNEQKENAMVVLSKANRENKIFKNKKEFIKKKSDTTCYNCQKKGHFASECKAPKKSKITCYNCQKKGHYASECKAPKKPNGNKQNFSKEKQQGNLTAFSVNKEEMDMNIKTEDTWIMDSGSSSHMSYRREFFETLDESTKDVKVFLGDNRQLDVKGIGRIKIQKLINNKWFNSVIENVFFVPELKKNLFSEGIITKKGMKIVKEGNKVTIYAEKKIVAIGTRQSNNIQGSSEKF